MILDLRRRRLDRFGLDEPGIYQDETIQSERGGVKRQSGRAVAKTETDQAVEIGLAPEAADRRSDIIRAAAPAGILAFGNPNAAAIETKAGVAGIGYRPSQSLEQAVRADPRLGSAGDDQQPGATSPAIQGCAKRAALAIERQQLAHLRAHSAISLAINPLSSDEF